MTLVLATVTVALVLLTVVESILAGSLAAGFPIAARTLFFFADVVFYAWVPFLVISAIVRGRRPSRVAVLAAVLAGAAINVLVVALIGFVQEGRLASFVAIAVEGSLAVVVAAGIVVPVLARLLSEPREPSGVRR